MRIVIDFDQTIADSSKGLYDIYVKETGDTTPYNPVHKWNFDGLFPDSYKKRALQLFCTEELFEVLKPFENAIEVITRLSEKHEIYVCTNHKAEGIPFKDKWIKKYLPFAKVVYVDSFDKSITSGDIFIDDKIECLESVKDNYEYRICYGSYLWNEDWSNRRCLNWLEVEKQVSEIEKANNICSTPSKKQYKIHSTLTGHKGFVYDKRISKNKPNTIEYYIFDEKTNKYMWLNDDGGCYFTTK